MSTLRYIPIKELPLMKSYTFKVVLEKDKWPDEPNEAAVWRAYVPLLEEKGAATWGRTKAEAIKNIQEVMQMVIEEMVEDGQPLPTLALVAESQEPLVTVTVS